MERPQDPGRASDEDLLGRVAALEPAALGELYDRHGPTAYSLARRMVGADRAEDAVQEAFLGVWRGARRYDPARGTARSWLLALVRNRCIDVLRRTAADERRHLELERAEHTLPPTKPTDEAVADAESVSRCAPRCASSRPSAARCSSWPTSAAGRRRRSPSGSPSRSGR